LRDQNRIVRNEDPPGKNNVEGEINEMIMMPELFNLKNHGSTKGTPTDHEHHQDTTNNRPQSNHAKLERQDTFKLNVENLSFQKSPHAQNVHIDKIVKVLNIKVQS
jgi:hypothetical protein